MGLVISYSDTPLGSFEDAMSSVSTSATRIQAALDAVKKLANDKTWVGQPANEWNSWFLQSNDNITRLLTSLQPGGDEYQALRAQAEAAQAQFVKENPHVRIGS